MQDAKKSKIKKAMKFFAYISLTCVGFVALGLGLAYILKYYELRPRAWLVITFIAVTALLIVILMGVIVYTLSKVYSLPREQKSKRIAQKILAAGGTAVTLAVAIVLGLYVLVWMSFAYKPEHVVEKHGQKMVAYVDAFLDVSVEYYEYKNFLVCGYDSVGWELYGNGSFDPFERNPPPVPSTYIFYDARGKVIARSEEKQTVYQEEAIINHKAPAFPPERMQCTFSDADARAFSEMSYSADGDNWEVISTGYHFQFMFENTGYLVFSYDWAAHKEAAAIYRSTDSGESWLLVSDTPSAEWLQNAVFFDKNTGIFEYGAAGTDDYLLYVTADGANTFKQVELPVEIQGQPDKINEYLNGIKG